MATMASIRREIRARWTEIVSRSGIRFRPRLPKHIGILGSSLKTEKGEKIGVLTAVVYLSPAMESGAENCAWRTPECTAPCLGHSAGQLSMGPIKTGSHKGLGAKNSRLWKTALYHGSSELWGRLLYAEIRSFAASAKRQGYQAAVRLDGSSDLGYAARIAEHHRDVQFYDYTKSVDRALSAVNGKIAPNYHVTFSRSGRNDGDCLRVLQAGGNVAVVFSSRPGTSSRPGDPLPTSMTILGETFPCLDGDASDVRFRDPPGHVVALSFKQSRAREKKMRAAGSFVVDVASESVTVA